MYLSLSTTPTHTSCRGTSDVIVEMYLEAGMYSVHNTKKKANRCFSSSCDVVFSFHFSLLCVVLHSNKIFRL